MKRGQRFGVALLSAALTFGVLFVTVGTDHWERYGRYHHGHYHYYHDHHDDGDHDRKKDRLREGDEESSPEQGR